MPKNSTGNKSGNKSGDKSGNKSGNKSGKKPLSPYMQFSKEMRHKFAKPGVAFGDVGKALGEAWRGMSDAQKAKYYRGRGRGRGRGR